MSDYTKPSRVNRKPKKKWKKQKPKQQIDGDSNEL